MKKFALLCASFAAMNTVSVQAEGKTLFMDSQRMMQESKEGQALVVAMSKKRDELVARIQSWQEELKAKAETLDKQRALLSPEVAKEKEEDIAKKSNEYTRQSKVLEEGWQEDVRSQQMRLFEKFKKTGAEVCKKEKGDSLIDAGMPGVYYVSPEVDITKKVIEAADIQYLKDQAAATAATGKK